MEKQVSRSAALYRLRKMLSELSSLTGRGTELVSLYVPPRRAVSEVINALRSEWGTAANIKSDTTRNHVQDALTRVIQRLKLYEKIPETGLIIFCGALPTDGPGSETIRLYELIPPKPVTTYLYRCDDHFHLDPLRSMLKEEKLIGVLSIDATEAGVGVVRGDQVEVIDVITSGVSGKTKKGGQSQRRYEREREMFLTYYYQRVAERANEVFLGEDGISGLIIAGPGPTKEDFLKKDYLNYQLKNKVLGLIDTSYSGSEGVREVLERAAPLLEGLRITEERKLVEQFFREQQSGSGLVVTDVNEILRLLPMSVVDTVLISEDAGFTKINVKCKACGYVREGIFGKETYMIEKPKLIQSCPQCTSTNLDIEERDLVDLIEEMALPVGTKVEVISTKNEAGMMFKNVGGIGAILRYRLS
jgi:peptide chain release factor subunit 1